MFERFMRLMRKIRKAGRNKTGDKQHGSDGPANDLPMERLDLGQREHLVQELNLASGLESNIRQIIDITGGSFDVTVRRFEAGTSETKAAIIYIDGMVDDRAIEDLVEKLTIDTFKTRVDLTDKQAVFEAAKDKLIPQRVIQEISSITALWDKVSMGDSAVLFDGYNRVLVVATRGWETRAIEESSSETTLRGPREAFIESLRVNTSLIRRRLRTPNLRIMSMNIGKLTKTEVAYAYIEGLTGNDLVKEVDLRLREIDIDGVLESGYLEEFIEDTPFTIFPLMHRTEKPDAVAAALLEGRLAVFTDGTPFVLVLPADLNYLMQAPDDYYEKFSFGTLIRMIRYFALATSILLPGAYVSVANFHQELLPTSLVMRIAATREGIPFPVVVEVLILEFLFEMLREAGVRLPRAVGQAISIVGALILGDAAIRAGLVSPGVVIIVALTAIASFSAPAYSLAIAARELRFIFIVLGGTFGLFGIQFGLFILITHLSGLRSFGQPYLAPFAPLILQDLKDSIIRVWWWGMCTRPKLMASKELKRQPGGQRPYPGKDHTPERK
jgi:spore germination protein KA